MNDDSFLVGDGKRWQFQMHTITELITDCGVITVRIEPKCNAFYGIQRFIVRLKDTYKCNIVAVYVQQRIIRSMTLAVDEITFKGRKQETRKGVQNGGISLS